MRESDQIHDIKQMRLNLRQRIIETYGLKLAFRENMPQSNILYFIDKTDEELLADMNSGAKEKVKNGFNKKVEFLVAHPNQYEEFYQRRSRVAGHKGFAPVTRQQFQDLMKYLREHQAGEIFITMHEGEILAGSICIFDGNHFIYLYGFTERGKNKYGGHHYLKFRAFGRAREQGFDYCDMLGGAPTGFPEHPLAGVSSFKESL